MGNALLAMYFYQVRGVLCAWMVLACGGAMAQWGSSNLLSGADGLGRKNGSAWGYSAYPAALRGAVDAQVSAFGEKRYMTEIALMHLALAAEVGGRHWLLGLDHRGTSFWATTGFSVATAQPLSERAAIALRLGYRAERVEGYAGNGELLAGFGAVFRCTDKLVWGMQVDARPVGGITGSYLLRTGLGYSVSPVAMLSLEAVAEPGISPGVITAFHYSFHPAFVSRFGYASSLSTFSFSQGFIRNSLALELAAGYHLDLGLSAGLSISWIFNAEP
jgi:hypothetical protein